MANRRTESRYNRYDGWDKRKAQRNTIIGESLRDALGESIDGNLNWYQQNHAKLKDGLDCEWFKYNPQLKQIKCNHGFTFTLDSAKTAIDEQTGWLVLKIMHDVKVGKI